MLIHFEKMEVHESHLVSHSMVHYFLLKIIQTAK